MIGLDNLRATAAFNESVMAEDGLDINAFLTTNDIDPAAFQAFVGERVERFATEALPTLQHVFAGDIQQLAYQTIKGSFLDGFFCALTLTEDTAHGKKA